MGKIYPSTITDPEISTAEIKVFHALKVICERTDWHVLHSYNLKKHISQRIGEIDFLVIAPEFGLLVIEVKGGGIARNEGVWTTTNRNDITNALSKSPLDQAKDNMFSLEKRIKELYPKGTSLNDINIAWACIFPDVNYFPIGEEHELGQIGWKGNMDNLEDFCKKASLAFCKKRESSYKNYRFEEHLPKVSECKQLVEKFRPDFELQLSLKSLEEETEAELIKLTQEQFEALDAMDDNMRVLFRGGAGTGKTLLAAEAFRRSVSSGNKTLFLVYSKLVSEWMKDKLADYCVNGSEVDSIIEIAQRYCPNEVHDLSFFENKLPYIILERIEQGLIEPFDYLIIDEAQDILNNKYYDVADALLKGGLQNGQWVMFGDFERQAVFHETGDPVELLRERNIQFSLHRLKQNCRNTSKVYDYLISFSGFGNDDPPIKRNKYPGDKVEFKFYKSDTEQAEKVTAILKDLLKKGISPNRISLLSNKTFEDSCLNLVNTVEIKDISNSAETFIRENHITFADIKHFKGLENNYILILDIDSIEDIYQKLLYVAISRCKFKLYLFFEQKIQDKVFDQLPNI